MVAALAGAGGGIALPSLPTTGLALHLDAGEIINLQHGTALTNWTDLSGNAYTAVPGVAPTYLVDGGGGYPAVRFDGIDDFLQADVPTGTNASVFVVYANRRDPLLVEHQDTLLSNSALDDDIHLAASRYVDGEDIVQFGWDKDFLFNAAYQAQIGADEIIQWNAVDSMDGGTWYNGGTLPNLDDAAIGASLTSPSYGVTMTSRTISSSNPAFTNTIVNNNGTGMAVGPPGGADVYFRETGPAAWGFDFDREVELRQIMFDSMGNAADRVLITIEGSATYTLTRNYCEETSAWSGDGNLEIHTFATPIVLPAGTEVTLEPAASGNAANNIWQLAGVMVGVPKPPPDYPGFVYGEAAGVEVEARVNGRNTRDAGTDIFRDRYYIGSAVYSQAAGASTLTIGAGSAGAGDYGQNDIREILVYDQALDQTAHNAVLTHLGEKYSIEVVDRPLDHAVETYNHLLGAQQIGRQYNFGESGVQVLDAARAVYRQGSRVFTMALSDKYAYQNGVQDDPSIGSLTELVRDEAGIRAVLDMPFTDILLWASTFAVPKWGQVTTDTGLDAATEQLIYDEIYDFTVHLLTNYNGSGKSFYIGNWEGDWLLAGEGSQDPENDITIAKINGMIDWATVRQQAIDDAKAATPHSGVEVWYYLEMNRGDWAIDGRPCVVNSVMPFLTKLDFVSFSAYTIRNYTESQAHAVLDLIQGALPAGNPPPGPRLIIGEYGYVQGTLTEQEQADLYLGMIRKYLTWNGGPPRFILMWEFFWNETGGSGYLKNMHQITEDNERHKLYYLHENFYRDMRRWVETYYAANGIVPSTAVYAARAVQALETLSLFEYDPCLDDSISTLVQFGGAVGSISNAGWQAQIGAKQIIQWNGVNSWGGSFNANGSVGGNSPGQTVGATLWSSNAVLTLTSRDISSTLAAGDKTYSSGTPNVLGITGGDNAKFDHSYDEEWTFDFDRDIVLKQLIVAAMDFSSETVEVTVDGVYTGTFVRADCDAVTWSPTANRYVYTLAGGGLYIPAGTDITIGATSVGVWGLQGIVVKIPGTGMAYDYTTWASEWDVDIGSATNDYDLDGLPNIYEFGLGGDPTNSADLGIPVSYAVMEMNGSNVFAYVHPQRSDPDSGLTYCLETTGELQPAAWTNAGYVVSGTNDAEGTFDYVTNHVEMLDNNRFIRLIIE
jgi:hypothetical protein